eukprot:scaffold123845_cov33-Tisochrysis_lutea.AAC.1
MWGGKKCCHLAGWGGRHNRASWTSRAALLSPGVARLNYVLPTAHLGPTLGLGLGYGGHGMLGGRFTRRGVSRSGIL